MTRYLGLKENGQQYKYRDASPPKIVNSLTVEERDRRRKNYEALRAALSVITGSDQWDAYTYSELLEGARNALASELLRIK